MKLNNKRQAKRDKKKGFTLLEMSVYVAVFLIITVVIYSFIVWLTHSNIKAQAIRETLDSVSGAMGRMIYEIRSAQSIYSPTATSSQLSLETLHYLPEGQSSTSIDFFLCGTASTTLCLRKESQDPIALTSDKVEIKNLSFSQIATATTSPSIQISLEASYKNPSDLPEYRASVNVTSTASLRTFQK